MPDQRQITAAIRARLELAKAHPPVGREAAIKRADNENRRIIGRLSISSKARNG